MTEDSIASLLIKAKSGSPFSLTRKNVLLSVRNVSWGFFKEGESDIMRGIKGKQVQYLVLIQCLLLWSGAIDLYRLKNFSNLRD